MSKPGFTLGDYIEFPAVFKTDTREQIEYIDLDRIDPDPGNFYSLEGLEELAGNIELVGLQQPLRVRENPSAADGGTSPSRGGRRYVVVSGHRRRAACLLIRDGGSDMFRDGVPCIVERGEASPEMQELRLIYANSATRVMTSAELSKQAERVEELLYKLKEQGVVFPGRMRDHVAAAVNASKTKLARLHAIRGKLVPPLLKMFDAGEINESVAYRISQEEAEIQEDLAKAPAILRGETAEKIGQIIDKLKTPPKPVGADVPGGPKPTLHEVYIDNDGLKSYLAERAEEDEKYFEMLSDVADRFLPCVGGVPSRREGIEALKQKHGSCYHGGTVDGKFCWYFNAEPKGLALEPKRGPKILRTWTEVYDLLCTIAVARLLAKDDGGRSRTPAPTEIRPTWMSGTPPRDGRYLCRVDMDLVKPHEQQCEYRSGKWFCYGQAMDKVGTVVSWWPLPERG